MNSKTLRFFVDFSNSDPDFKSASLRHFGNYFSPVKKYRKIFSLLRNEKRGFRHLVQKPPTSTTDKGSNFILLYIKIYL